MLRKLPVRRGFTIAELLIYLGIFSAVSMVLYGVLSNVMESNSRESSANELTSQLNTVLSTVQTYVKGSSQIEVYEDANHLSSATTSGSYLMIRTLATSTDPTCIYLSGGVIKLAIGPDPLHKSECTSQTTDLTTSKAVANSLTFMVAQQAGGHAFVQVDARLSNNTTNPKLVVSKNIQSVIGRASAATFDSDLLPNADNTYSVGQTSPDMRWRNGSFAGTVTVGTGASGGNLGIGVEVPGYPLDVQAATGQIQIKSTTGTNYALLRVNNSGGDLYFGRERSAGGGLAVDSTGYAGVINAQSAYPLQFAVNNHVAMTILNSGYVGVGTSTPSVRLEAYPGPVKLWGGSQYYTAFQNGNEINMFTSSTVGTTMYLQYASNAATNIGKSALYIQGNNGNVGMGTTGPGQKLDVIGNIRASGVIMPGSTSTPPTTCNSSYASSIYYNSSDTKMYYCNGTEWKILGAAGQFFGDGSDGAFFSTGDVIFPCTQDTGIVVKQYTSFTLNTGNSMTVNNRCRGLIIYSQGNVVINGSINMSGKAAWVDISQGIPPVIALNINDGLLNIGKTWDVSKSNNFVVIGPTGYGGDGGNGGSAWATNTGVVSVGGKGGYGSPPGAFGGGRGGGGGGGGGAMCTNAPSITSAIFGGAGANAPIGANIGGAGATGVSQFTNSYYAGNAAINPGAGGSGVGIASGGSPAGYATIGAGGSSLNGGGAGGSGAVIAMNSGTPGAISATGGAGTGNGGGIIIIIANGSITINSGSVLANGSSGASGSNGSYISASGLEGYGIATGGGGGGGAGGGAIGIFYKTTFANNGSVIANGGNGGSGGSTSGSLSNCYSGIYNYTPASQGQNGGNGTVKIVQL